MSFHPRKIYAVVKEHWMGIVLGIAVGLVMVGPQVVFMSESGADYKGLYIMRSDAETHYLARMREFYDNNGLGNALLYEYKNLPSPFFTISESILASPGRLLGISVPAINLFYKFFLPLASSLLIYFLAWRLMGSKTYALAAAAVVMMGNIFFSFPSALKILSGQLAFSQFSAYSRPVNPQFSSIIFFIFLHFLLSAIAKREWKWFAALGGVLGLSFYVYYFSFSFLMALSVIFIFIFYLIKRRDISKKMLAGVLGGIILGIPALINLFRLARHPLYANLAVITEFVQTHAFRFSTAGIVAAVLFGAYLFRSKKINTEAVFIAGLLATSFAVINQQVVTGTLVHEGHYHWYFNIPIFTLAIFWTLHGIFKGAKNGYTAIAAAVIISASVYGAVFVQYSSYSYAKDDVARKQDYVEVFDWLNKNSTPDSVVLADAGMSQFIPVYTGSDVYWSSYAAYYLLPAETIEQRLFMYLNLNRYKPVANDEDLKNNLLEMSRADPDIAAFTDNRIIDIYPAGLALRYKNYLLNLSNERSRYRLDYIVVDANRDPEWELSNLPVTPVFQTDRYKIFNLSAENI